MNTFVQFFVFCTVLFLYIHIQFHLKRGQELELYEISDPSKEQLNNVCDNRQPVLFNFPADDILKICQMRIIFDQYHNFDLSVRDITAPITAITKLPLREAVKLFISDPAAAAATASAAADIKYLSESNGDFLAETGVQKYLQSNDGFLRPSMLATMSYDLWTGKQGLQTPLRYDVVYRNFFLVTEGQIQIKLIPAMYSKYLSEYKDYAGFEFISPVNPWHPSPQFSADFSKVKCLDFTVSAGKCLYIPAYWWFSMRFDGAPTTIVNFKYKTFMNMAAISPIYAMHFFELQNLKRNISRGVAPISTAVSVTTAPHVSAATASAEIPGATSLETLPSDGDSIREEPKNN